MSVQSLHLVRVGMDPEAMSRLGEPLSRHEFAVERSESGRFTGADLQNWDVLAISALHPDDVEHVRTFIEAGGGVAIIGERSAAVLGSLGLATRPAGAGRLLAEDGRVTLLDHAGEGWISEMYWAALRAFGRNAAHGPLSDLSMADGAWERLREAVNVLRGLQADDGSIPQGNGAADRAAETAAEITACLPEIASSFEHQRDYLEALQDDFQLWQMDGWSVPDFGRSLARLAPHRLRVDGARHLCLMPMYTPNASRSVRFEALILQTIWPEWLDQVCRSGYSENTGFIPGVLVDFTDGYDSECAVVFPETVSVKGPAPNEFGVLLCEREAERYQSVIGDALGSLRCDIPPRLEALLESRDLAIGAFALWDLMHDTSHRRGELPFDPFLVRQRSPFWMYALEELRVDLRSYLDAFRLIPHFPFAQYVCFTVLLDRIIRFPITGTRERNYDALGGQILFAALHADGAVKWEDGKLWIFWEKVDASVERLEAELRALYRRGQILSKPRYWGEGHDLISRYLQPNMASEWCSERRRFRDESDLRSLVDAVHDDEFPLGTFHLGLRRSLAIDG